MKISITVVSVFIALALAAPTQHGGDSYWNKGGHGQVEQPGHYYPPQPYHPPTATTKCESESGKATPIPPAYGGWVPPKAEVPEKPPVEVPAPAPVPEKPVETYVPTPAPAPEKPVEAPHAPAPAPETPVETPYVPTPAPAPAPEKPEEGKDKPVEQPDAPAPAPEKPVEEGGEHEETPDDDGSGKDVEEPAHPGDNVCYVPPPTLDWTTPRTHTVIVGGEDLLRYEPAFVRAKVGDIIKFEFLAKNHTLTQSSFEDPCTALPGGIDSGFKPNPDNVCGKQQFEFTVKDEKPMWFYCQQGNHCSVGMVFAVNPPKEGNTYTAFLINAIKTFVPPTSPAPVAPVAPAPEAPKPSA